jgi:trk system potassium uptake protein TrkA
MKSILVIGMGRFGRHLAQKMKDLGNEVMVIDKDEELIQQYLSFFADAEIGDCANESVVESLGVENFDLCFVAIGGDFQSSLVVTSLLKEKGANYVISKAKRDIQADLLKKIGADEVVYPEREMAEKLAVRCNSKNVFDYIELSEEYSLYEIPILPQWVGQTIGELNIRRKHRINIIAIKKDKRLMSMPEADYTFENGDHIVVIGGSSDVFKLTAKV